MNSDPLHKDWVTKMADPSPAAMRGPDSPGNDFVVVDKGASSGSSSGEDAKVDAVEDVHENDPGVTVQKKPPSPPEAPEALSVEGKKPSRGGLLNQGQPRSNVVAPGMGYRATLLKGVAKVKETTTTSSDKFRCVVVIAIASFVEFFASIQFAGKPVTCFFDPELSGDVAYNGSLGRPLPRRLPSHPVPHCTHPSQEGPSARCLPLVPLAASSLYSATLDHRGPSSLHPPPAAPSAVSCSPLLVC